MPRFAWRRKQGPAGKTSSRRVLSPNFRLAQSLSLHLRQQGILLQATGSLICALIALAFTGYLEGSEFSGGWLTGRLLNAKSSGGLLFLAAVPLTFLFRRIAALIALLGCFLCLPLYLFFLAPGIYRRIFGGQWKVVSPDFRLDWWPVCGLVLVTLAFWASFRVLAAKDRSR